MIGTNLANSSDTSKFLPDGVDPRPGGYAMRPTNKLFLFALIIFLLFGTVPAVYAQTGSYDGDTCDSAKSVCADPCTELITACEIS